MRRKSGCAQISTITPASASSPPCSRPNGGRRHRSSTARPLLCPASARHRPSGARQPHRPRAGQGRFRCHGGHRRHAGRRLSRRRRQAMCPAADRSPAMPPFPASSMPRAGRSSEDFKAQPPRAAARRLRMQPSPMSSSSRPSPSAAGRCASNCCRCSRRCARPNRGRSSPARCAISCRRTASPAATKRRVDAGQAIISIACSSMAIRASPGSRIHSRWQPRSPTGCVYTGLVAAPPAPRTARALRHRRHRPAAAPSAHALIAPRRSGGSALPDNLRWCSSPARTCRRPIAPLSRRRGARRCRRWSVSARISPLLAGARLSVSQAGYNTVCDLLRAGCRCVLIPFAAGGETEQTVARRRLEKLGLADVLAEDGLTPESLR